MIERVNYFDVSSNFLSYDIEMFEDSVELIDIDQSSLTTLKMLESNFSSEVFKLENRNEEKTHKKSNKSSNMYKAML